MKVGNILFFLLSSMFLWNSAQAQNHDKIGHYVDSNYHQGSYEWRALIVETYKGDQLSIAVRSNMDLMDGPLCTTNFVVDKISDNVYMERQGEYQVIFTFGSNGITITTDDTRTRGNVLTTFCVARNMNYENKRGIGGHYEKLSGKIDMKRLDYTTYKKSYYVGNNKYFSYKGYKMGDVNAIHIESMGFGDDFLESIVDKEYKTDKFRTIASAMADLDNDGQPEFYALFQEEGRKKSSRVLFYYVTKDGLQQGELFYPEKEHVEVFNGYRKIEYFYVKDNQLIHEIPIHKSGDKDGYPTGGTRVLTYKLDRSGGKVKMTIDKVEIIK